MKKYIVLLLLVSSTVLYSQRSESIDSDRPGQSYSARTVGKNVFQVQSGLNYLCAYPSIEGRLLSLFNDARYGISESFELNGSLGYSNFALGIPIPGYNGSVSDFSDYRIGARVTILNSKSSGSNISLQGSILFSVNNQVATRFSDGFLLSLNYTKTISDKVVIGGNFRILDDGFYPDYILQYTINSSFEIGDRSACFIELFGLMRPVLDVSIDGGFLFVVNNDVMLDISGGLIDFYDDEKWFIDAGVSFRLGGEVEEE